MNHSIAEGAASSSGELAGKRAYEGLWVFNSLNPAHRGMALPM